MNKIELSSKLLKEPMSEKEQLLQEIEQAKFDWIAALSFFHNAIDATDINLAIYKINSAEQLYSILLKEAKKYYLSIPPKIFINHPICIKCDGNIYSLPLDSSQE